MLESLKPISPGWWWVRTCCCARAVPTSVKVGRAHLSIELWGEFIFFPLCVPHSSTCENRIVFCLRNVYVWTSVLSLDKSIEKEKKIFPFSHSYSFFFSFSAATTERGPSSNDPSHGYSNGWLFQETISLLPHIDIEAPTRCTRCSSYSVSRKIGFFFLADILWNIWRRDGWCHLISGPDQQQQQRASI